MDWIKALTASPLDELTRTELIQPQHGNPYGTLFAPEALSMLGKTAYLAAARFSRQSVVMAASREIEFLRPIAVGSLLHLHARVVRLGRCSMTLEVHAAVDAAPGITQENALRATFEMVAVDASGRPTPVAPRATAMTPSI